MDINEQQKKLKERIVSDGEKAVEQQLGEQKNKRQYHRKVRNDEQGLRDISQVRIDVAKHSDTNAIKIIEEEIGKEQLIRLAVKYLYNAIVEAKNA